VDYKYETFGSIQVAWTDALDGGGRSFGRQYLTTVEKRIGPVERAYEFCAGPGFIGFALLAHGLCKTLCLSDVNPVAVAAVQHTIELNGLEGVVDVYLSDALDAIPPHEQWDLVVSNPPHFDGPQQGRWGLRVFDPGWEIHRKFYAQVRRHLKPHGQCLIQENYQGSTEATFVPLLRETGMELVSSFMLNSAEAIDDDDDETKLAMLNSYYFLQTRPEHPELIDVTERRCREIAFVRDRSGVRTVTASGAAHRRPLHVAIGEQCVMSTEEDDLMLKVLVTNPRTGHEGSKTFHLPFPSTLSPDVNPRRVIVMPVVPCKIVDPQSSDVLIVVENAAVPSADHVSE
jgi:methylase of polypeptide subunit release factors